MDIKLVGELLLNGLILIIIYNGLLLGNFFVQLTWKRIDELEKLPGINYIWHHSLRFLGGIGYKDGHYYDWDGNKLSSRSREDGSLEWCLINAGLILSGFLGFLVYAMWPMLLLGGLIYGGIEIARIFRRHHKLMQIHVTNQNLHRESTKEQ